MRDRVDELWKQVKDRPNLGRALDDLERAGLCKPVVVVPKPTIKA